MVERIEYASLVVGPEDLEDKLNGKGRRGWTLVSCVPIITEMPAETPQGIIKYDALSYHCVLMKPMGAHPDEGDE